MESDEIDRVRRFNRTVTERIGVLQETYLDRGRPLAETRMLWEIGPSGAAVGELRRRLGLDSGYASRLLRSLERQKLVRVSAAADDRRGRRAQLTAAGRRERAQLDRMSDRLAGDLLDPLDDVRRGRLVAAMDEVERLLRAAMVTFEVADPATAESRWCVEQYYAELARRFDAGFDAGVTLPAEDAALRPPTGAFVLARLRGEAVGCAGLKFHEDGIAELKRLWLSAGCRGLGVGRRFLDDLERRSTEAGARAVRLDTNRALTEAIALYRAAGYREIEPFTAEPYADYWFEKPLRPD